MSITKFKKYLSVIVLLLLSYLFLSNLSDRTRLYTIVFIGIVSFFEFSNKKNNTNDIFYPKYFLLILFYLYSLGGMSYVETFKANAQGTSIPEGIIDKFMVACWVGLLGLCTGFYLLKNNKNKLPITSLNTFNEKNIYNFFKLFIFFALVFNFSEIFKRYNFLAVESYAERALSYRLERGESTSSGLYEVFMLDSPILLINFFSIKYFFKNKNKILLKWLYLMPFILSVFTAFLSGFRSSVVSILLPLLFLYHYTQKQFIITFPRIVFYVLLGIITYIIINLMSVLRNTSDPLLMVEIAYNLFKDKGLSFFSIANSGELETSTNFMRLLLGIQNGEVGFTWGKSFLDEILVFIPRYFYPNRPHTISEQFVMTFYPQVYNVGGGMGQFLLLEGYWAFGIFGVFLTSLIYSFAIGKFYLKLLPYLIASPIIVLLYSQIFDKAVISVVRGGYIGAVKGSIISTIVIIFAILLNKIKLKKRESRMDT